MQELAVKLASDADAGVYLETLNSSIKNVAANHYSADVIKSWVASIDDKQLGEFVKNSDQEVRVLAVLAGEVVGIGAIVYSLCELRACYVLPSALRRGVGTAIVRALEQMAQAEGVSHLQLHATTIAEPFYRALGYATIEPVEHITRGGHAMQAFSMRKCFAVG